MTGIPSAGAALDEAHQRLPQEKANEDRTE